MMELSRCIMTDSAPINGSQPWEIYQYDNHSTNSSLDNFAAGDYAPNPELEAAKYYLEKVVNPIFCVSGIVGNVINIAVLAQRRSQSRADNSESVAHVGLISLAISDMLYCVASFLRSSIGESATVFSEKGFHLYVQIYMPCFVDVFIKTSTWLTVILALSRYIAICHPLHSRLFVDINLTKCGITATFVLWLLLHLPLFWTYSVTDVPCRDNSTLYVLVSGYFGEHHAFKLGFTLLWFSLGFLIPACLLAFCNVRLIQALRESTQMRRHYRVHTRTSQTGGSRITPTLIAIVIMFLVLVTPSEILAFIGHLMPVHHIEGMNLSIVLANVLQTMNFAVNFVLYCAVNASFRKTFFDLVCMIIRRRSGYRRRSSSTYANNTKSSVMYQSASETVL